jgi:hypothetical protein
VGAGGRHNPPYPEAFHIPKLNILGNLLLKALAR